MKFPRQILLLASISVTLTGCLEINDSDLKRYADSVMARPATPIEPLPEPVPYVPFSYTATFKRDPFQNQDILTPGSKPTPPPVPAPDDTRPKQYLESFDIGTFIMVGTIENDKEHYALLRNSVGVHRVKVGDYIGFNYGKVISISDFGIEIVETVPDGNDGWIARPYTLELKAQS